MVRKLFMTDIHGEYDGMMKLLEHARFDPAADRLVIGGDMVSRGPDSGAVLRELRRLALEYPGQVTVLAGNHEEMMTAYVRGQSELWLRHAGRHTVPKLSKTFGAAEELQIHLDWAASLPLLHEDDEYVYTHAGLVPSASLQDQDREILWMTESDFYAYSRQQVLNCTGGRTVVHGHTPCEYIYSDGARVNCDLGAHSYSVAEEQALALVDLTGRQYDVYKLYSRRIMTRKIGYFA